MSAAFRVLAKKIAPGQESLGAELEHSARWAYFRQEPIQYSYFVYVDGSEQALKRLTQTCGRSCHHKSGDNVVWAFDKRTEANLFAAPIYAIDGLSFWLVGFGPNQSASATDHPTLGYFLDGAATISRLPVEAKKLEELLRSHAADLLVYFGSQIGVSIIFFSPEILDDMSVSWLKEFGHFFLLGEKRPRFDTVEVGQRTYGYVLFDKPSDAREFFLIVAGIGEGSAWQFGLGMHPDLTKQWPR